MQVQTQLTGMSPQLDTSFPAPLLFWLTFTGNFVRVDLLSEGFSVD